MESCLMQESVWFNKLQVEDAECKYYEHISKNHAGLSIQAPSSSSSLVTEITRARENIQTSLNAGVGLKVGVAVDGQGVASRLSVLEKENEHLKEVTCDLQSLVTNLQQRLTALEKSSGVKQPAAIVPLRKSPQTQTQGEDEVDEDSDSDDGDLFASDEESEKTAAELKKQLKEAEESKKKSKKVLIAKSNIILDVKPLGDDTDMEALRDNVKSITIDGLLWGSSKFVAVAYGIKKLQISCVVEDDKVSMDDLEEKIMIFEEFVQSVDVVAFNKV